MITLMFRSPYLYLCQTKFIYKLQVGISFQKHNDFYFTGYADFQQGLDMARAQFEQSDWGIVAQAVQDRAMQGLKLAEKHLPN